MDTNTQQFLDKINISTLKAGKNISNDVIDQSGDYQKKLFIKAPFDGYYDVMFDIKTLAKVIETLSLESCATETENLGMISVLSKLIQKIMPDMDFIDDLIFEDVNSSSQNFKTVNDIL